MKKILAAIAMLLVAVPFVKANALNETTNYYSYKKGQIVNFYPNKTKEDAHASEATEVFIIEDKDTSDKFVKVWMVGGYASDQEPARFDLTQGGKFTSFKALKSLPAANAYTGVVNTLNNDGFQNGDANAVDNYFYDFTDATKGVDLLTIADLQAMLGDAVVKESATRYVINDKTLLNRVETNVSFYEEFGKLAALAKANKINDAFVTSYWLGDVTEDNKIWTLNITRDANEKITAMYLEPVVYDETDGATNPVRAFALTMYANKTADCHQEVAKKHCYKCKATEEGKFTWIITTENDSKIETCEIVPDAECNPKTGSKSHLLEFSIVAALCAISLLVVRRKDLFRTI